ncbi:deacetylase sulfotransferase [Microtetraspora sp. NBRC 13810]|uniref:sulfotransferase family protein n=1 Tax=Microtetraspora sp. NBRC 13810 TaxID=3030990 RepID=UPI00249FE633|nr:sulfotransferase [Microtetraspora sp. NBRC 13810]GLW07301.1 deacetylase sulfotransferase [Microtetraspora sp. NBRC 13810]
MTSHLKRSAHAVSLTTGRLTSGSRILPSFLIVGAQRCGTTSLYRALAQHPLVLKPVLRKGVHFFDVAYRRGLPWYRAHFPLRATAARLHRRFGHRPLAFESSPYYLFHPLAGARIAWDLPGVKLIVLVRDPVERAYSAYLHELARGFEQESSFEHALQLERRRLAGEADALCAEPHSQSHAHRHHAYLARGRYAEQIGKLEAQVGRQRLLVLDSHRFFADPDAVYDRVLEFLGLPHVADPVFERHNARPRPAPMTVSLRRALRDHFEPWDSRLRPWLGEEPSWRR